MNESPNGPEPAPTVSLALLLNAINRLVQGMEAQNEVLIQALAQNSQLIGLMLSDPEEDETPTRYMDGSPIRDS